MVEIGCFKSHLAGERITIISLRKGACSAAFERGAPISDLKTFGAWRSHSVLQYLLVAPVRLRMAKKNL